MANFKTRQLATGVGRIVGGDPTVLIPQTDQQTGLPKMSKKKPTEQMQQCWFHLAIPKTDPSFGPFWQQIQQIAQQDWPQGEFNAPTFKWKYLDGDGIDVNGKAYSEREGYAGCHILKFSQTFLPSFVDNTPERRPLLDNSCIKAGHYVQVLAGVLGNGPTQSPGVYMNPIAVSFVGYGEEIHFSSVDAAAGFGNVAAAVPVGVSATPLATAAPMPVAVAPVAVAPVAVAPVAVAPVAVAPVAVAPVAVAPVAVAPVAVAPVAVAPVAVAPVMTAPLPLATPATNILTPGA